MVSRNFVDKLTFAVPASLRAQQVLAKRIAVDGHLKSVVMQVFSGTGVFPRVNVLLTTDQDVAQAGVNLYAAVGSGPLRNGELFSMENLDIPVKTTETLLIQIRGNSDASTTVRCSWKIEVP